VAEQRPLPPWLSLPDAGEYVGISTYTLRRYIAAGHLQAFRAPRGRLIRVRRRDLDALLESHRIPTVGAV
jgi:excisionase family DNA binding protein